MVSSQKGISYPNKNITPTTLINFQQKLYILVFFLSRLAYTFVCSTKCHTIFKNVLSKKAKLFKAVSSGICRSRAGAALSWSGLELGYEAICFLFQFAVSVDLAFFFFEA